MRWPARIGRWEIRGSLGAGGTAEVLLGAGDDGAGGVREVAIKRPLAERVDDEVSAALLRGEAEILRHLRHPGVVQLVELIDAAPPAVVLERLRGATLAARTGERALPVALVIEVGAQAAAALAAVHAAVGDDGAPLEVVHRDLSPHNLFVEPDGRVCLLDFNVAAARGRREAPVPGAWQGRIAYMAPEQARGEPVDGRADVFSLGVVLWELAVGGRLLWRGNTLATLRALVDEPIPRARSRRPALPPALDALLGEMLAPTAADRPDAAAVARRLEALRAVDGGAALAAWARVVP